jgi:parvulin-like peptidyl-prolyl isomerase
VRKVLHDRGLTLQQFKELQTQTLLVARLLWREVYSEIKVSPAELRQYYDENVEEFRQPAKVRYRQILLPVVDEADAEASRQRAERVMGELEQGAEFAELADRWSADSEGYPGGLHEVQVPEDAPDWRPQAVAELEEGETSGVRRVTGGFAITRLEHVVPARVLSFEEAQPQIRAALIRRKRAEAEEAYVERLRSKALIERYPAAERLGA